MSTALARTCSPTLLGSYDTPYYARDVYVSGNVAYVADDLSGLQIIDVSNPSAPALLGSYNTPGSALGIYVSGSTAYVADWWSGGLQIIDVSNPLAPALLGSYDTPGFAYDVYVSGSTAYVADRDGGLQIIDVSNPALPVLLGSYNTPGYATDVYVSGNVAYVANGGSGLQIIDVSNPALPALLGSYDTPSYAEGVYISGNVAYVADGLGGLQIIDVSNPASPTLLGSYDTPYYARGVYVLGNVAYVADRDSGLQIIDVSSPSSPALLGSYDTPGEAYGVYVSGGTAYVADWDKGLQVINISGCGVISEDCTNGIDDDGNGLVDCDDPDCVGNPACPTEEGLLEKYAPILYMHPDERFHPTKVQNMLDNSKLFEIVENKKGKKKPKLVDENKNNTLTLEQLMSDYNDEKYYLQLKNILGDWKEDQTVYGRQLTVYYNNIEKTVLQYWFFYVYNDWGGGKEGGNKHEGDWEMIQIILGSNKQPEKITYSFHHGGLTFEWSNSEVNKDNEYPEHPLVFVTLGGHGSWNRDGDNLWYQWPKKVCLKCTDRTAKGGSVLYPNIGVFSSKEHTYRLEDISDVPQTHGVYWKGYWGKQTEKKMKGKEDYGSSGPEGPPYIDYIEGDGLIGRWWKPISWAEDPNPSHYTVCASANSKLRVHDLKGNVERLFENCRPVTVFGCSACPSIKIVCSEKDLVFDVYSLDGKEVDLKIERYKRAGEVYEVEYKGLNITKRGKASLTFSPELNPGLEMRIDKDLEGFYESYRMPDYLEVKEVDE